MVDFAFQCRLYGLIPGWGAKIPHASVSKDPEDRSNIVTKSIKTFKMVHIKKKLKRNRSNESQCLCSNISKMYQYLSVCKSQDISLSFSFFIPTLWHPVCVYTSSTLAGLATFLKSHMWLVVIILDNTVSAISVIGQRFWTVTLMNLWRQLWIH